MLAKPSMSQRYHKTNQFNLTTKKYTEGNIQNFINDSDSEGYAFSVADKFGDSGVNGLGVVTSMGNSETVEIDKGETVTQLAFDFNLPVEEVHDYLMKWVDQGLLKVKERFE